LALSTEVRLLAARWQAGNLWPRRLEWLEIQGIRGWDGQRLDFTFPIVALCGENGVGKSTVLQAAVSVYRPPTGDTPRFASEFFPDTAWERIERAAIRYCVREGQATREGSVRKPTVRWLGNPQRRERAVRYLDLRRSQPIAALRGYPKLIKSGVREAGSTVFDAATLRRYSAVLGRAYTAGRHSWTNVDNRLRVPVVGVGATSYSGFHQGAGEMTVADLFAMPVPRYGLVAIDEVETSLHPRAQRRLVRDLAELARLQELQILLTTHSPYVLEELPPEGRLYVVSSTQGRSVVKGISAEFALTKMDDEAHPEGDVYVEDDEARCIVFELLFKYRPEDARRVRIIKAGAASVVTTLGIMVDKGRFPRPTVAVLDGDAGPATGCLVLPGGDAPERVVFGGLVPLRFAGVPERLARRYAETVDALEQAMTLPDHHEWCPYVADRLQLSSRELWSALARIWIDRVLPQAEGEEFARHIVDSLGL
jgi:predicted ATPase